MDINICCSGSSGSTMLSHILNRHEKIYCGEELGLFSKNILYEDFTYIKKKFSLISKYGISSRPYFEDKSILRNLDFYNLDYNIIGKLLEESESFSLFVKKLKTTILKNENKSVWAEKTPENIYMIKYFLKEFPDSKVIHIVRDPRDVILSLMKRGLSMENAAEVWLTSVSSIQPFLKNENVYEVRYEDIVSNPKEEIEKICLFLDIKFQDKLLSGSGTKNRSKDFFKTWENSPNQNISTSSMYKYKNSKYDFTRIFSMKITQSFSALNNTQEYYLIDLLKHYGYDYSKIDFQKQYKKNKTTIKIKKTKIKTKIIELFIEKNNYIDKVEY